MTILISSLAMLGCGLIIGMIAGKLLTEREMQENLEQYGNDMNVEGHRVGYNEGYHDGYEQAKLSRDR